jgi:hypothetical protein
MPVKLSDTTAPPVLLHHVPPQHARAHSDLFNDAIFDFKEINVRFGTLWDYVN